MTTRRRLLLFGLLAGLLALTQQQLLEAWVGYIPMVAPAIPTAIKVLGSFQRGAKTNAS